MSGSLSSFDIASSSSPKWFTGSLTAREVRRRFWHMSPGLLPIILQVVPHADPVSPTLRWIFMGVAAAIGLRILWGFRQIQRANESGGIAPVAGYTLSVIMMLLLFPQHLELAFALLAILAFGDGSATLFGLLIRGPRLPWNRDKSWSGLMAFIGVGSLMAAWIYSAESFNLEAADVSVSFVTALMLVTPAVVVAAISESVDSRINDNIRVGVIGAVMLIVTHMFRPM
jgi:dolichol kinase